MESAQEVKEPVCWDSEDLFAIGIQIRTFAGMIYPDNEELIQLDTGYDGELLLPSKLYRSLALYQWEYPEEYWPVGKTVSGEIIELILAKGQVLIPRWNVALEVFIETFEGNEEFLLGRSFIRKFKVLLDGPGNQVCLIGPSVMGKEDPAS
jgi:predicted aspartyl protease